MIMSRAVSQVWRPEDGRPFLRENESHNQSTCGFYSCFLSTDRTSAVPRSPFRGRFSRNRSEPAVLAVPVGGLAETLRQTGPGVEPELPLGAFSPACP